MSIYHDAVEILRDSCEKYKNHEISLNEIKQIIWKSAQIITAIEERTFRNHLIAAEAELDTIQFTCDEDKVFNATLPIILSIEELS